ncbi:thiamine phosphate synthase, partial [Microbacterium sp. GbtcB4]|uniref:thiamine phosphate synthase n=1 Tax=Microbacterium sp. GbtcB4 TaxID=2824749 RepID=UPI001C30DCE3
MTADLSLYLVTDRSLCGARGVDETVREAVAGGVRIVQLRDKEATGEEAVDQLLAPSVAIVGRALL